MRRKTQQTNNPSRLYLRSLSQKEREELGKKVEANWGHLTQIAYGQRSPGKELAIRLELVTMGRVRATDFLDEKRMEVIASIQQV